MKEVFFGVLSFNLNGVFYLKKKIILCSFNCYLINWLTLKNFRLLY